MTRKKNPVTVLIKDSNVDDEMLRYAEASSNLKRIESEIELSIQKVREKYATEVESLREDQERSMSRLQYFAEFHREDLFSKKKSKDYSHGTIGFRIGQWKCLGAGKKALEAIKALKMKKFIRQKEEIDKEKIIDSREDANAMKQLNAIGVKVTQDETFYIEVKEEELATA